MTAERLHAHSLRQFDYGNLFSFREAEAVLGQRFLGHVRAERDRHGHSVRGALQPGGGHVEYCSFDGDVLLVASELPEGLSGRSTQLISDGDWVHIQFRLSGGGTESRASDRPFQTPAGSCIVSRHPDGTRTMRDFDSDERWKAVCLYLRPSSVSRFFDIPPSGLPAALQWLGDPSFREQRTSIIPLDTTFRAVTHDILATRLDGHLRRTYLRGKILELFALTIGKLSDHVGRADQLSSIQAFEYGKLHQLTEIMSHNIDKPVTLKSLARKIGTNRTRLTKIFKECNGVGVQEHWRRMRLQHAVDLLSSEQLPVTEVAMRVGYANVSSLTRAFIKEFGVLPKDVRSRKKQFAITAP